MNENKNICPCCGKGCDLGAPGCHRGEEYLRTGVIPSRGESRHKHDQRDSCEGGHHEHGHGHHELDHGHHGHDHGHHGHDHGHHEHDHGHHEHDHGHHEHEHKGIHFSDYDEMDTSGKILAQMDKLGRQSRKFFGGRGGQKRILHILGKSGGMTQRELTELLDIKPGSASEIIKKLEAAGYIVRTANETDRRTADISLTEAGRAQVQEADDRPSGARSDLFGALSTEEIEQLLMLLEKLSADWDSRFKPEKGHKHGHHHGED